MEQKPQVKQVPYCCTLKNDATNMDRIISPFGHYVIVRIQVFPRGGNYSWRGAFFWRCNGVLFTIVKNSEVETFMRRPCKIVHEG